MYFSGLKRNNVVFGLYYGLSYRDNSTDCSMLREIREVAREEKWLYWANSVTFICTGYLPHGNTKCRLVFGMVPLTASGVSRLMTPQRKFSCVVRAEWCTRSVQDLIMETSLCVRLIIQWDPASLLEQELPNSSTEVIQCKEIKCINEETKNGS